MNSFQWRGRTSLALAFGASAIALGARPALAQEDATTNPGQSAPEDVGPKIAIDAPEAGGIVVTGSRLRTNGAETPIPVTAVSADELQAMAPSSLIAGVSQLPQFFGNQTVAAVQTAGGAGNGFLTRGGHGNLDLRGLGINRTLTLLDGRRMVSASPFGGVDINVFPEAMISSVEVVTGGASAAYGTDAIAGVTNFKLNRNFTGLEARLQGGVTDRGDNESYKASVSFGTTIGDRAHFILSGEVSEQDGIHSLAGRDWYRSWGTVNGEPYPDVVSANASWNGIIFAPRTPLQGMEFLPDGSGIVPFVRGTPTSGMTGTPPARHSITNGGSGDYVGRESNTIFPDAERNSIFAYADYELTPDLTVFAQYIRGQNKTFRYNDPAGSLQGTPTAATIFRDNAFLPASVRQTMINRNIQSFTLRRVGSPDDLAPETWFRDNSVMNSFTGGAAWNIDGGGLFDGWLADAYYQYGTNRRKAYQHGLRVDRIFAALDAVVDPRTGQIVCRVSLFGDAFPGCKPINLFGRGNASAEAIDYVTGFESGQKITTPVYFADSGFERGETMTFTSGRAKVNVTDMRQHVAELTMSGDVLENWAGTISAAFGGSYRKESIRQVVHDVTNPSSDHVSAHPVLCNGEAPGLRGVTRADCLNTVGVQFSKVSNIRGAIDVKEAFAEALVPLIVDLGPIDSANLHLAARWADYTGSGSVWAYKAGLDVELADFLRLRGTYSRDVRAANLTERFDRSGGLAILDDPRTPEVEAMNVTRISGGNPEVHPEKANTWTVGAVLQPPSFPGFSLSADYYDITIDGAIGQLGSQAVLNGCLRDNVPQLCELVTLSDGVPVLVGDIFINVNEHRVRGLDVEAGYRTEVSLLGGDESVGGRLFASWLFENSETLASGVTTDRAGQTGIQQSDGAVFGLPDFKATGNVFYNNGGFRTFVQGRYIGSGTQENSLGDIPVNRVDSAFYVDLRLSYEFEVAGSDLEVFGMVSNLTDKNPPVTPFYSVFAARSTQSNSVLFDLLGRRYTMGLRLRM